VLIVVVASVSVASHPAGAIVWRAAGFAATTSSYTATRNC
jgi:hypothetical protein